MPPRGEVLRSPVPWSELTAPAAGWILGYVRTDAPGYREIEVLGNLIVIDSDEYRFDDLVDQINTQMTAAGLDNFSWENTGHVYSAGDSETFPDRLGWVLGLVAEAGDTIASDSAAGLVPPAGIPLIAVTWTEVVSDADRRALADKFRRNQGYVWGSALIWRVRVKLHRWALEALKTGWCLAGKICVACADMLDTPISASEPRGAITGYALGLDGASWLDSPQRWGEVDLYIVTE